MTFRFKYIFLLLFPIFVLLGCAAGDSSSIVQNDESNALESYQNDDDALGIIIGNPSTPKSLQIFPNFDEELPNPQDKNTAAVVLEEDDLKTQIESKMILKDFVTGTLLVQGADEFLQRLTALGEFVVKDLVLTESKTEAVVSVGGDDTELMDKSFDVKLSLDLETQSLELLFFDNSGLQIGSYEAELNEKGEPIKGILALVNPDYLTEVVTATEDAERLTQVAFDFSGDKNHLLMRGDWLVMRNDQARFLSHHLHYQCDETEKACVAELILLKTASPERVLHRNRMRFAWSESSDNICLQAIHARTGEKSQTIEIAADASKRTPVSYGSCELPVPLWDDHVYVAEDLPTRFLDTLPYAGLAGTLVEGSFSTMSLSLVDFWTMGERLDQ
jgi:hypothetical protein